MIPQAPKQLRWIGFSREDVRAFPPEARQEVGWELRRVQVGQLPKDWKPMKTIGPGVSELRVHGRVEHRVIYVVRFEKAIYVLHAFQKRTRKTPKADIETARRRLAALIHQRRQRQARV